MANAKIVVCADEDTGKKLAAALKKPAGGGYTNVDGPFKTNSVILETYKIGNDLSVEYGDQDGETWFVVGRK